MTAHAPEWFDAADSSGTGTPGLRFACTQCGNCCSGPEGYVGFTDAEASAIAKHLGISHARFLDDYTKPTHLGRSLKEVRPLGRDSFDCVFLDRDPATGKALCSIYDVRPTQCRTWPFWDSVLRSPRHWARAAATCPGINSGPVHAPTFIRLTRERVRI
jgi:hypothetical protein